MTLSLLIMFGYLTSLPSQTPKPMRSRRVVIFSNGAKIFEVEKIVGLLNELYRIKASRGFSKKKNMKGYDSKELMEINAMLMILDVQGLCQIRIS